MEIRGCKNLKLIGPVGQIALLVHIGPILQSDSNSRSISRRVRWSSRRTGGAARSWHSAMVNLQRSQVPSISSRLIDGSLANRTVRSNSSSQRKPSDTDEVAEGFNARCRAIATQRYRSLVSTNLESCTPTMGSTGFLRVAWSRSRSFKIRIASQRRQ